MLCLLETVEESGHDLGEIWSKLLLEDARHDTEEEEAALLQPRTAELDTSERLLHHAGEVGTELLLADGISKGADGVHGDTTKLLLLALTSEDQEVLEAVHGLGEVGKELLLGGVSGATDGANND